MSKRTSAKYKLDRRMGENVFGRPKSPVNRREYGPGQHGQRRKGKVSDFGIQLRAKQKLKGYYGDVTEKQFKRAYTEAAKMKGDTGQNLIGLLERRLDAVVYRAKFAPTIWAARQIVNHGHIRVNGKKLNIASAKVNVGDVDRARPEGAGDGAGDRGAGPRRARHPRIYRPGRHHEDRSSTACRRSTKCPIRCGWSPIWSSNSIRAELSASAGHKGRLREEPPFFIDIAGDSREISIVRKRERPTCGNF